MIDGGFYNFCFSLFLAKLPKQKLWHFADRDDQLNAGPMYNSKSTIDYQRRCNVGKQLAQPYSDCGKSNFPIVDVRGLFSPGSRL